MSPVRGAPTSPVRVLDSSSTYAPPSPTITPLLTPARQVDEDARHRYHASRSLPFGPALSAPARPAARVRPTRCTPIDRPACLLSTDRSSEAGAFRGMEMAPREFMGKMLTLMGKVTAQHEEFLRTVSRSVREANERHQRLHEQLLHVCNDFLGDARSIPQGSAAGVAHLHGPASGRH